MCGFLLGIYRILGLCKIMKYYLCTLFKDLGGKYILKDVGKKYNSIGLEVMNLNVRWG